MTDNKPIDPTKPEGEDKMYDAFGDYMQKTLKALKEQLPDIRKKVDETGEHNEEFDKLNEQIEEELARLIEQHDEPHDFSPHKHGVDRAMRARALAEREGIPLGVAVERLMAEEEPEEEDDD